MTASQRQRAAMVSREAQYSIHLTHPLEQPTGPRSWGQSLPVRGQGWGLSDAVGPLGIVASAALR